MSASRQTAQEPADDVASIEWYTRFRRYTPPLLGPIVRIERALAVIKTAHLLPAAADQMRASARAGTVHYSTLIEGNELPLIEAERAARGELDPVSEAKIELINYVAALEFLDRTEAAGELVVTPSFLLNLHGVLMKGLGRPQGNFKPHHEGAWRDGEAVIPDGVGGILHQGAPRREVAARMLGLCDWISRCQDRAEEYPAPVVAGVAHYAITDVHPFANGNGRMARLVASAILLAYDYLPGKLFSFEAYYARDRDAYLAALRSVPRNSGNQESWLQYFLEGLAEEYERVQAEVETLAGLGLTRSSRVQLTPTQQRALSVLATSNIVEFSRADYQRAADVGKTTAHADIDSLLTQRLVRQVTGTRGAATRYTFAERRRVSGRPLRWTEERIEDELRAFTAGRTDWPKVKEFQDAGRSGLHQAIKRAGGAKLWAERLGLQR